MEKLIELLNEWQEKRLGKAGAKYLMFDGINKVFGLNNGCSLCQELVLSHRFCFIEWLVENDKIDIKALIVKGEMRSGWDFDNKKGDEETGEESWNKYFSELCLMILAIQDEPISFLISILK